MPEARDPAIKLFGKTIPLSEDHNPEEEAGENSDPHPDPDPMPELAVDVKDICIEITDKEVRNPPVDVSEELGEGELESSSSLNNGNEDDHQTPSTQGNKLTPDAKAENDQSETDASGQEKVLKKPDKVLPCPRCNSLDTKFCYYNNYNVNQPRHFCKGCQRYWTAGGTMRNVPVGAGRRKNKHSTSHYRHIMMSSNGIPATRLDAPDSAHNQALSCGFSDPTTSLKGNGTVLKFGTEAPLCESMASVLNLGDQKINAEMTSTACGENSEEPSCASSVTASNCMGNEFTENAVHMEQNGMPGYCNGLNPMQCYPGPPFAYPWSPGWNNVAAVAAGRCSSELVFRPENGSPNLVPWNPPQMMAAPAFCAPTMPFPFMPTPYWGCVPSWPGGTWNVPWVGSNGGLSPSSSTSNNSECSGNGSPTLGKHSRDASLQGEEKREKSLWVPKTLRIDDPDDAAKSSIWATLGIKPDEPITKGGIFKAFHSKTESKVHTPDAAQALHANPAAMSRSQKFQEST